MKPYLVITVGIVGLVAAQLQPAQPNSHEQHVHNSQEHHEPHQQCDTAGCPACHHADEVVVCELHGQDRHCKCEHQHHHGHAVNVGKRDDPHYCLTDQDCVDKGYGDGSQCAHSGPDGHGHNHCTTHGEHTHGHMHHDKRQHHGHHDGNHGHHMDGCHDGCHHVTNCRDDEEVVCHNGLCVCQDRPVNLGKRDDPHYCLTDQDCVDKGYGDGSQCAHSGPDGHGHNHCTTHGEHTHGHAHHDKRQHHGHHDGNHGHHMDGCHDGCHHLNCHDDQEGVCHNGQCVCQDRPVNLGKRDDPHYCLTDQDCVDKGYGNGSQCAHSGPDGHGHNHCTTHGEHTHHDFGKRDDPHYCLTDQDCVDKGYGDGSQCAHSGPDGHGHNHCTTHGEHTQGHAHHGETHGN